MCDGQSDGQTDILTDGHTGKNNMSPNPDGRGHNLRQKMK